MSDTNQQPIIDYASIMLQFNNDPDFIKLRDRYATKSFLEIMSTDRSETRHSSFLAWLLEGKDFPVKEQDHPIIHLLDILIRRESEQSTQKLVHDDIKNMVLSRNIKSILIHEVSTEKLIKDLSTIQSIDRLDIYIHCTIEPKNGESKKIEFIIENKVGSKENGPKKENKGFASKYPYYVNKTQTERYYYACKDNAIKDRQTCEKIFIYLTPISNADLSDFDNLGEDQKSKDGHFININYQDILDNIIEPLLSSEDISTRIHTLLNEYVLSLSLPALIEKENENEQNIKGSIIMATRKVDIENIENLIKNHNYLSLIKDALKEVSSKNAQNKLLLSFGETYRKLFTAILRVYIETGSANRILDELDELRSLYYQLLGNPNPKDNTKFSIYYKVSNKNELSVGKTSFAITMLKAYIDYHKNNLDTPNEQICKNIHNYYPRQNNKLCVVLLKDWYTKIEEGPKCQKQIPDPKDISIPSSINLTTYVEYQKEFLITKLWAVDRNGGKSTFENLLNDICGPTKLKDLKQEASYHVDDLENNWNEVLAQAGIKQITIHPNN